MTQALLNEEMGRFNTTNRPIISYLFRQMNIIEKYGNPASRGRFQHPVLFAPQSFANGLCYIISGFVTAHAEIDATSRTSTSLWQNV